MQAFEPRKLIGGIFVLLLHLLAIAGLLSATRWASHEVAEPKEIILNVLPIMTSQKKEKKQLRAEHENKPRISPAFSIPPAFAPLKLPKRSEYEGLNRQLFACSPDQLAVATPEERSACASASLAPHYNPNATDYHDHTDQSKDAPRWARSLARKNGPLLLPCANPRSIVETFGLGGLLCLVKAAKNGKIDLDAQPTYSDKPVEGPRHLSRDAGQPFAPID